MVQFSHLYITPVRNGGVNVLIKCLKVSPRKIKRNQLKCLLLGFKTLWAGRHKKGKLWFSLEVLLFILLHKSYALMTLTKNEENEKLNYKMEMILK